MQEGQVDQHELADVSAAAGTGNAEQAAGADVGQTEPAQETSPSPFDSRLTAMETMLRQLVEAQQSLAQSALGPPPLTDPAHAVPAPAEDSPPQFDNPFVGSLRNEFGVNVPDHVLEEAADAVESAYRWQDFLRQNPAATVEQRSAAEKAQRRAVRGRRAAEWHRDQAVANKQRDAAINPSWGQNQAKSYAEEAINEFRQRTGPANKYAEMPEALFAQTLARVPVGDSPESWQQSAVALLDVVLDMHRAQTQSPNAPATRAVQPPTNPAPSPPAAPSATAGHPYPDDKILEWEDMLSRWAAATPN